MSLHLCLCVYVSTSLSLRICLYIFVSAYVSTSLSLRLRRGSCVYVYVSPPFEIGKLDVVASPNSKNTQIKKSRDATARKFPNKIELLSADLITVREDLTFGIDPIFEITEYSRCTAINNCLNGKIVNSLIDSGNEDTTISKNFTMII